MEYPSLQESHLSPEMFSSPLLFCLHEQSPFSLQETSTDPDSLHAQAEIVIQVISRTHYCYCREIAKVKNIMKDDITIR